jgi:hypothetical protein
MIENNQAKTHGPPCMGTNTESDCMNLQRKGGKEHG